MMGRKKIKPDIFKNCQFCDKNFIVTNDKTKFCTQKCYFDSIAKPTLFCNECGSEIKGYKHHRQYTTLFCNKKCQGNYLREPFNEHFFEDETPEVAYWAGFLMADGYVRKRKWHNLSLSLSLAEQDKNHIEKFCNSINLNIKNIKLVSRKNKIHKKQQDEYRIDISSPYFEDSLLKWGLVPRKTYVGEFPKINNNLIPHYIRGLIDGDGCISYNGVNGKSISLCGSENVIKTTASILLSHLNVTVGIRCRKPDVKTGYQLWVWSAQNIKDIQLIGNWIYKDVDICLERKYNKMCEIYERWPTK